jgi:hypothetical protein
MKSRVIQDGPNTGEDQTPGDTANLLERESEANQDVVDDHEPVEPSSERGG